MDGTTERLRAKDVDINVLAPKHPERVECYVPVSVGHPGTYLTSGLARKIRGYYILLLQVRGIIDWIPGPGCCIGAERLRYNRRRRHHGMP